MKKLLEQIAALEAEELERASEKFGATNASDHESYAIIAEEVEESTYGWTLVVEYLEKFWKLVKLDHNPVDKEKTLELLELNAVQTAAELVQVAAMARKAINTIHKKESDDFNKEEE